MLQNALSGSRIRIRQSGQFSSACGPCTTAGKDPLFPDATLSVSGGTQTRTYAKILDFTVGPGLGTFRFDTSNLYKDVQLTERVRTMGSGVLD